MPGQNMSEKWWSNTRRFRSKVGDISCRISYSSGTAVGSLLVATGLFVDQAKVWADPQATRFIFLPCKAATNLGLCMALVLPSPEIIKNIDYWHFMVHFVSNPSILIKNTVVCSKIRRLKMSIRTNFVWAYIRPRTRYTLKYKQH